MKNIFRKIFNKEVEDDDTINKFSVQFKIPNIYESQSSYFKNIIKNEIDEAEENGIFVTPFNIKRSAETLDYKFADILLFNIGIVGICTYFDKKDNNLYLIRWIIENGDEFESIFTLSELLVK